MKTEIIFHKDNENALQKSNNKDFEKLVKESLFLALLDKGIIDKKQYEKALKLMDKN